MQFERVATRHNPTTAAEVFALARVIRERKLSRDAEMSQKRFAERIAAIAEGERQRAEEKAKADALTKWTVGRYRLAVDIEAKGPAIFNAFEAAGCDAKKIKIDHILHAVCACYSVTQTDVLSHRRHKSIILPRQVAMYLARVQTLRSLPEIGRRFGGRDHTTVMHAVEKIERLLAAGDERLASDIAAIKQALGVS